MIDNTKHLVLVIEDDAPTASVLERFLRDAGHEVIVACDGEEGTSIALQRLPDLVLTDLGLPKLDGYGVIDALRANAPVLPIIVMTATGQIASAVRAMQAGADDYLEKPLDLDVLAAAMARALERRRLRAEAESFFALSIDLLCIAGFDGYFKRLNAAWETTLGWSIAELRSKEWLDFVHPGDRTCAAREVAKVVRGETSMSFETRFRCKDGSNKRLRWNAAPVSGTRTLHIVARDVTEETLARDQVEQRFRLLVESVRDYAIFIVDVAGRVVTWNSGAQRIKGYAEDEIVGEHMRCFYPHDDVIAGKPEADLQTALATGRAESEGWGLRKDGARFWANVVTTPLFIDGDHVGYAQVTRDLTEQRRLEDQFRHAQKMEAVGRLAGGIAHDFNNVLSVILSYADMIRSDLGPDEPVRADIDEIKTAAMRAADLTRQLLTFSRHQVVDAKVLDVNATLSGMEKMLRRLLGADIELTIVPGVGLANVKADPGQIEQIVMNLAVNARDAMTEGGKLRIETANVDLDEGYSNLHHDVRPGPYVKLAVNDTGVGMDADTQARMFEPFFTTKDQGKGTGLGLSTVFGIVKQSGGHIAARSRLGEGTTFEIYLPKCSHGAEVRASQRPLAEVTRGSETVLVVEDDDQVRTLAGSILRRNGYVVLEAANGGEALLICEQEKAKIDLLVTDVVLPRMSGRQLAERVVALRPDIKVLFMSGYNDDVGLKSAVESGAPYLQKPLSPATLARRVRDVLHGDSSRNRIGP